MSLRTYERLKSLFILIAFVGAGFSLATPTPMGTASYIVKLFPLDLFVLSFILGGIINFVAVWLGYGNNAMWFAPFFAYLGATFLAWQDGLVPFIAVILYALLASLLALDVIADIRGGNG